jgi:2-polyprenyl-6-methoxyphenol hydroxylase-like FAD-dependent oxidoreductase
VVEQGNHNPLVGGSNPSAATNAHLGATVSLASKTNHRTSTVSVLIAGAGPVGLALAAELGRLGIGCLLVEKRDGSVAVPKMSQVSARSMEFCRRWGIADTVKSAVWPESHALDFVYAESLTAVELARVTIPSYATRTLDFTPEGPCHCPQIYFDPILAAHVKSLPGVSLRYGTSLESFESADDGVHARLIDAATGHSEVVSARYLVGCDGPGGIVRSALGIDLCGQGVVASSVNVFFRSPELSSLHDKGWARFYRLIDQSGCWAELIPIDGRALWRLTAFDDRTPDTEGSVYLRRMLGADFPHQTISVTRWERRDHVAARYREGRVFIVGDAAHQCSPTGGLGMHTGIEEAVNLAWKLAAALEGWGGPWLLDSYEAERRAVALRNVALATGAFEAIRGIPPVSIVKANPDALSERMASFSVNEIVKLNYDYEASPICIAGPDASGGRAPHGWLSGGRSTLDLFGNGFTLLRFGGAPVAALTAAARQRGVPFQEVTIADPSVAALYGRRLVLVRPDGHIAWRGDVAPDDPLGTIDRMRGASAPPRPSGASL